MLKMFTKKDTNTSLSNSISEIDQEILDHRLSLIELNNRIAMLQEKKVLLTSYLKNETLLSDASLRNGLSFKFDFRPVIHLFLLISYQFPPLSRFLLLFQFYHIRLYFQ